MPYGKRLSIAHRGLQPELAHPRPSKYSPCQGMPEMKVLHFLVVPGWRGNLPPVSPRRPPLALDASVTFFRSAATSRCLN